MPFVFTDFPIKGLRLIEPKVFRDERGAFAELYKESDYVDHAIATSIVQVNYSVSSKGTLRGLHYQLSPAAQSKLVSVTRGEIFDVVCWAGDHTLWGDGC